jgi:hypothetical protein
MGREVFGLSGAGMVHSDESDLSDVSDMELRDLKQFA